MKMGDKKMMKRILATILMAALMMTLFAGFAMAATYVQATRAYVNVRSGPGTGYTDLWTLVNGEKVEYLGTSSDGGWHKVQYYSYGTGWVAASHTKLVGGSSSGSSSSSSSGYVEASKGNSNVRSQPNLNGRDLGTMNKGATASYLGQQSTDDRGVVWYKVNYNGTVGWVSSRYTTLHTGSSGSTSLPDFGSDYDYVYASGGDSNIRNAPNLNARAIDVMHKGDTAEYLGQQSIDDRGVAWYKVYFEGVTGWVSSRYTSLY